MIPVPSATGAGMVSRKKPASAATARLRRMYIDCRYGQLHLTAAYPASGGFDEASPLVFLHADGGSGADFNACAAFLGSDRSVYAPDLPGSGASDAPRGRMTVAGLALAVVDLMEQLRLRKVDLAACGRGALVAFELATTRPQAIRKLVVAGPQQPATGIAQPMLHASAEATYLTGNPPEIVAAELRTFLDRH